MDSLEATATYEFAGLRNAGLTLSVFLAQKRCVPQRPRTVHILSLGNRSAV